MKIISALFFCMMLLAISGCKMEGSIKALEETSEWQVERCVVKTSTASGEVKEEAITKYSFFRMKEATNQEVRFANNVFFKYSGKYFELGSNTIKTTFWSGNPNSIRPGTEYAAPKAVSDLSGATNFDAFLMSYSSSGNLWTLHPAIGYNILIRKSSKKRLKVIITTLGGQSDRMVYNETVLDLIKN